MTEHHHSVQSPQPPADADHGERRVARSDRRTNRDRRSGAERRHDSRLTPDSRLRPLKNWLKSLVHPRLGVDRRKRADRRQHEDRRQQRPCALLTPEEINDLLS